MKVSPFIKWPGGKNRLLSVILDNLPEDIKDRKQYVEPFLGAGAVFLYFLENYDFEEYVVNDINHRLINIYETIKNEPQRLMNELDKLDSVYQNNNWDKRKEEYYKLREEFNSGKDMFRNAVLFIYLNKTCFNGLYRENKSGGFNSPIGKYENPSFYNKDNILDISRLLNTKKVVFKSGNFIDVEKYIKDGSFIYLDPPYHPINGVGYTTYKLDEFNQDSQVALKDFCDRLNERDIKWMLSNSDPHNTDSQEDFLDDLYQNYNIKRVDVGRSIGASKDTRKKIKELLIKNY